jgi:hypothetical protein
LRGPPAKSTIVMAAQAAIHASFNLFFWRK